MPIIYKILAANCHLPEPFCPGVQIYVYPTLDAKTGELVTADSLKVAPEVQLLYDFIRERGCLIPINSYNRCANPIWYF